MHKRRVSAVMAALFWCVSLCAVAQEYPSKPIRFVWTAPPGGIDYILRLVGQKMTERWGQPVVVDYRPGAGGIIAAENVIRSASDGYSLLVGSDGLLIIPHLQKLSIDPAKDLVPVALFAFIAHPIVLNSSVPANSLKELIALAKAKPGTLTYGTVGNGSPQHLIWELFKRGAGVDMLHVPYQGMAPALTALLGGQISAATIAFGQNAAGVKAGTLKVIAVITGTDSRAPAAPQVPTFAEGLADAGVNAEYFCPWIALFAPAGTPPDILRKLNEGANFGLQSTEIRDRFRFEGFATPTRNGLEDVAAFVKAEAALREKAIKIAGLKTAN